METLQPYALICVGSSRMKFDETCELAKPECKYLHDFARLGFSRTDY
jgi:hypothetical protein